MHVLKPPLEPSFMKVGIAGRIFPTDGITRDAEFFTVDTEHGHETTIRQRESDFFYYILSGSGAFIINDQSEACSAGDLVAVPRGKWFRYVGSMRMFVVSLPPWQEAQEDTLEDR